MTFDSKKIILQLSKLGINKNLISAWLTEYKKLKNEFLKRQWQNCISNCGLFSEYTVAILKELYDKSPININQIHFDSFYQDCITKPKPNPEDEILLLAVPNAAKTIYTIRNKKKGAHAKAIDPDYVDSLIVTSLSDYILSQFVLLKCQGTQNEIRELIQNIIDKKVPLVEEFEDGTIIIHTKLGNPDQILLALYVKGRRLNKDELIETLQIGYSQLADSSLKSLKKRKLIHENNEGYVITQAGEERVEKIIQKNLENI